MNSSDISAISLSLVNSSSMKEKISGGTEGGQDFLQLISQLVTQGNDTEFSDVMQFLCSQQGSDLAETDSNISMILSLFGINNGDIIPMSMNGISEMLTAEISEESTLSEEDMSTDEQEFENLDALLEQNGSMDILSDLNIMTAMPCFTGVNENATISIGNATSFIKPTVKNEQIVKNPFENFSELSTEEKIEVIRQAVTDGIITVEKDVDVSTVINKMSSNYLFEKNISEIKKTALEEMAGTDSQPVVFDYNKDTVIDLKTLKTNGTFEENSVFNQTLDSIEKAMNQKIEKFIVKFNPEGLGEITLSLEKDGTGKMLVNMMADSMKTADLLNKQLGMIQTNLTQYDAQVNPATVNETPQMAQFDFNQQMYGHQFSQQDRDYEYDDVYYEDGDEDSIQDKPILEPIGILNTYI